MKCAPCLAAEADPLAVAYGLGCAECAARALAHAPSWVAREQLRPVFGDAWGAAQQRVEQWRTRMAQACLQAPGAATGQTPRTEQREA